MPSTEFTFFIPVSNDTVRIGKVSDDREFLQLAPSGGIAVRVAIPQVDEDEEAKVLGRAEVGENLSVRPQETIYQTPIGDIEIPGFAFPPIALTLGQLTGEGELSGTVPLIPARDFSQQVELPLENVRQLAIRQGGMDVRLTNDLPVDLENVRMVLADPGRGVASVQEVELGTIAARGGRATGVFVLDGKEISGALALTISGRSRQAVDATLSGDERLRIELSVRDILATRAEAVLPEQEFNASQALPFPDDRIQIDRALIDRGNLAFRVQSTISLLTLVELRLDDLKKPDGTANTFVIDIEKGESKDVVFDLKGNDFAPINPLEIRFSYTARTSPSEVPVVLQAGEEIQITALSEELVFSRVEGRLKNVGVTLPEVEREVEFPDGLDKISLAATSLDMYVTSGLGFLADVELRIRGTNKFAQSGGLTVSERFDRGDPDQPTSYQVSVTPQELTPFVNLLPSEIVVEPRVRIGDGRQTEIIDPSHWVSIDSIVIRSSPRLTVEDSTRINLEVNDIGFRDARTRERIDHNYRFAQVRAIISNSMPLGVGVRLFVGTSKESVYTDPILTIPRLERRPFRAEAAPVDANGYSAGVTTITPDPYVLEKERLLLFLQDPLFAGVQISLPGSAGQVEIRGSDFVHVQSDLEIQFLLDEDFIE